MNERIFELAKQADLIQWDTLPSGARTPDHESVVKARKFAELIVKECAKICECEWNGDADTFAASEAYNECAESIKAHFGVKNE